MQEPNGRPGELSGPAKGGGRFAGDVLALGGGATIAHVIAFGCSPIISRLFTPEAFGVAAMFAGIVLIAGRSLSLRYESALMLPADDADAANLLVLSCICTVIGSGLLCLGVAVGGDWLGEALHARALMTYRWLIPVGVFTWGIALPLRAWTARHRRFRSLAAVNTAETAISAVGRIAAGLAGLTGGGPLIVTGVLARSVAAVALGFRLIFRDLAFVARHCSWRRMAELARQYIRFPLIDSWSAVLRQLSWHVPPVLLGASLGAATAGHFSRAMLLGQIPFLLAGNAVGQVFYQRVAAMRSAGEPIGEFVAQVLRRLIWISLLPTVLVALIGPEIFTVLLGGQWGPAGRYAQVLAAWLFFEGLAVPLWGLISVSGRLGAGLGLNLALVGLQVVALVVGGWVLADRWAAILLLAVAGAGVQGAACLFLIRSAGVPLGQLGAVAMRYLAYALPTLAIAAGAKWWLRAPAWQTCLAAGVASLSYLALVLRHDRWARDRLAAMAGRFSGRFSGRFTGRRRR